MYIRIKYHDGTYDYVPGRILDKLIVSKKVKQFYRYSEQRWVTVGVDRIRGMGSIHSGPERRQLH
jgi:hypothetical protein